MTAVKKVFRIETISRPAAAAPIAANDIGEVGAAAIMAELKALRELIKPAEDISTRAVDAYREEMRDAMQLKSELDLVYDAINKTKHEIATLHTTGFKGKEMARVTHELDAIVDGTAEATDGILSAAEAIDRIVNDLSARMKKDQDRAAIDDVMAHVVTIFEHCNFQDLTGQRINKVVNTLKFIEDRIVKMMDIWGGLETFRDIQVDRIAAAEGAAALLNGPRLVEDAGHATQDDIDALFS